MTIILGKNKKIKKKMKRIQKEKYKKEKETNLPNTKLRIIDNIISHSEPGLVLRRVNRFNFLNNTSLRLQNPPVLLRDVWQHGHDQGVRGFHLSEALGQSDDALHIVAVAGQERHVRSLWEVPSTGRLNHRSYCSVDEFGRHFGKTKRRKCWRKRESRKRKSDDWAFWRWWKAVVGGTFK